MTDFDETDHEPAGYVPIPSFARWRPESFDSSVVDRFDSRLRALRGSFSDADFRAAQEVVRRYAAVDTGAIEGLYTVDRGFTKTIATHAAHWESALRAKGQHVQRAIADAVDAYEYVLDVTTGRIDVSEMWLRQLHEIICRSQETYTVDTAAGPQQQPMPKGLYKQHPNSPTNLSTGRVHHYAPPLETPMEMGRFIDQLRGDDFRRAHPVLQASYAHYAYVCIHPFADGNGRVSRALASAYLYRSPGVPLVVFADQRDGYLDALEAADDGDPEPFVAFVTERAIDAVGLLEASLRGSRQPAAVTKRLQDLYERDVDDEVRVDLGTRLRGLVVRELERAISELGLPPRLQIDVITGGSGTDVPTGYESFGSDGYLQVWARSDAPYEFGLSIPYQVVLSTGAGLFAELAVAGGSGDPLEVWRRDLEPVETESLRLRIGMWADSEAAGIASKVLEAAEHADGR